MKLMEIILFQLLEFQNYRQDPINLASQILCNILIEILATVVRQKKTKGYHNSKQRGPSLLKAP